MTALRGFAAGCAATVPMTAAMEAIFRMLPPDQCYPLPPRLIAMRIARVTGIQQALGERQRLRLTLLLHFTMGSLAGAAYSLARRRTDKPLNGPGFGLLVWAANYLAILPALKVLTPATEHPAPRTLLIIVSHLVWGCAAQKFLGDRGQRKRGRLLRDVR